MDAKDIRNLQEAYLEVYEEVDARRAPKELLDRLNSSREGHMAQDGPNKPAYDAKQRLLRKAHERRMKMKEQIDLYDIILDHLLDEGFADSIESAEAIMVNMSEEWRDSIVEGWKPANTAKMSAQAYKLEKQRDPHYKVVDAAIKNLSALNTRQPSSKNVISRNLQLARLQRNKDREHGEMIRHSRTSDLKNPEVQKKFMNQAKKFTDNTIRQKTINTIANMQTRRKPSEQQKQSAVNRFDQTYHK
jgi:hypothetical protein